MFQQHTRHSMQRKILEVGVGFFEPVGQHSYPTGDSDHKIIAGVFGRRPLMGELLNTSSRPFRSLVEIPREAL